MNSALAGLCVIRFSIQRGMSPRLIYQKCCCIHYTQLDDGTNTYFTADFILENWYLDCAAQFSYAVMIINVMLLLSYFFNVGFSLLSGLYNFVVQSSSIYNTQLCAELWVVICVSRSLMFLKLQRTKRNVPYADQFSYSFTICETKVKDTQLIS